MYSTTVVDPDMLAFVTEFNAYILSSSSSSVINRPDLPILQDAETVFTVMDTTHAPIHGTLFGCARELYCCVEGNFWPFSDSLPGCMVNER